MSGEYALAFKLLGVGMITVFLILFLVVVFGNVIIRLVNKYFPEAEKVLPSNTGEGISRKKLAAITAAVNIATKGKGKITNIEKL
ncbi:OadG family protein [Prolixibacter denitrificans]|jgi:oxaloacetate decarboxylase gamma subunit|uniref:Oxaloacetate decarboxylase n=1 Tax=Prolixibacter denitrificans TaxID=1541063 RepID=A0A2P8CJE1_9BACT|nr:OadG family protein [Prolixibacter denitrificans]PSK85074.1 oxaloacetate decarboxylase gamma subunit [Prolixibacter denitrificans]GET23617.1 oxaloacetate decarboxylase [Prolixibacter denitrificans]